MVAVKRIRLQGLKEDEIKQLMKEVDLVKSLSHPSIVKYEGMARDDDTLSIEYPYGHRDDAIGPEGTTESTFTWNEETDSVDHSGEFPDTF